MSSLILADGKMVEEFKRPYFIAEVNSSHNGDIEVARKMVDAAVEAKCDCVKFQSWSAQSLYSQSYYKANPIAKRFVDKLSLTSEELKKMADYCHEKGIGFSSTPYSKDEVDFLVEECKIPFIKIASMEVNNPEFLKYIASKNVPIVLSTGMAEMNEIERAVQSIEDAGNQHIAILHCVSIYPASVQTINLNNIIGLRERFKNYPIGFSDHTLGDAVAIAATAYGASIIEKHLTLDSKRIGMDNQMAMEPEDLKILIQKCENVAKALGVKERIVNDAEMKQRENMRRSIVTTKKLAAGHVLRLEDLNVKRPGTGIPPERIQDLVGMKINK
ncbi:MAG: N-acetylneuraminate synthase family protein, partial [Acetivibrio ethanolgignens]